MAIISELDNNDTEEVELNLMKRSGGLFSFSDKENGFQCLQLFTNAQCLAWMAA